MYVHGERPFQSTILVFLNMLFTGICLGKIIIFVLFCELLTIFLPNFYFQKLKTGETVKNRKDAHCAVYFRPQITQRKLINIHF